MKLFRIVLFLAAMSAGGLPVSAQQTIDLASVSGRVTDPSGAVVPGARITARHTETNVTAIAVSDGEGGSAFPIFVSRDGGRSFSAPVRVSEDGWAIHGCPDDGPAIAVDARGTTHLVWPTVVGGDTPPGALFYASTRDGATLTPRVRIETLGGPKPSHPQIVVERGGRTFIAWDETVEGRRIAAVRELKLQPGRGPAFGEIVRLSTESTALYPVLAATDKGLVAVWATGGDPSRIETRLLRMP